MTTPNETSELRVAAERLRMHLHYKSIGILHDPYRMSPDGYDADLELIRDAYLADHQELQAENERLREWIRRGDHRRSCPRRHQLRLESDPEPGPCTCGRDELLKGGDE